MKTIVELKNLSKIYNTGEKEFKALDNIDLSIEKGDNNRLSAAAATPVDYLL